MGTNSVSFSQTARNWGQVEQNEGIKRDMDCSPESRMGSHKRLRPVVVFNWAWMLCLKSYADIAFFEKVKE